MEVEQLITLTSQPISSSQHHSSACIPCRPSFCHGWNYSTSLYGSRPHKPSGKEHFHPQPSREWLAWGYQKGWAFLFGGMQVSWGFPTDKLYSFLKLQPAQLLGLWKCPHRLTTLSRSPPQLTLIKPCGPREMSQCHEGARLRCQDPRSQY